MIRAAMFMVVEIDGVLFFQDHNGFAHSAETVKELAEVANKHLAAWPQLREYNTRHQKELDDDREQRFAQMGNTDRVSLEQRGFIYLCRNHRNGLTKIGFSRNPKLREKTLQSEEPELEFIYTNRGTLLDEQEMHAEFADKRKRGEWFDLSEKDVAYIKTVYSFV